MIPLVKCDVCVETTKETRKQERNKEEHKRVNLCVFPLGESKLPQNRRQQVFANGTLIINNVDRGSDEGSYRCIAENKEGESAFRDVGVKVLGESIFQSRYLGGTT